MDIQEINDLFIETKHMVAKIEGKEKTIYDLILKLEQVSTETENLATELEQRYYPCLNTE